MIRTPALLFGSVPLPSVEEVLVSCGRSLGDRVAAYPDGEVGDRSNWVFHLAGPHLGEHPDLVVASGDPSGQLRRLVPSVSPQERAKPAIRSFFAESSDWPIVYADYRRAMAREIRKMLTRSRPTLGSCSGT